jgi:hypothetical protein
MPLSPERERWAEALKVEKIHGDTAPEFIAGRVAALALEGDTAGVERWMEIAARLDRLRSGPRQ